MEGLLITGLLIRMSLGMPSEKREKVGCVVRWGESSFEGVGRHFGLWSLSKCKFHLLYLCHIDNQKQNQSSWTTLSLSKWWLPLKVIQWSFDNDRVIKRHKCRTFNKYYALLEAPEAKMSANTFKIWLTSPNVTAPFKTFVK